MVTPSAGVVVDAGRGRNVVGPRSTSRVDGGVYEVRVKRGYKVRLYAALQVRTIQPRPAVGCSSLANSTRFKLHKRLFTAAAPRMK